MIDDAFNLNGLSSFSRISQNLGKTKTFVTTKKNAFAFYKHGKTLHL
jgi:hypothetical protein